MRSFILTCGIILTLTAFPHLSKGQHPLTKEAKKFTYLFELGDGRLEGEGAELLLFEATRSTFFLVGEETGIEETPSILWAIYQHAYKIGLRFNHLAVDVSPSIAIQLQDLALEPDADRLMKQFFSSQADIASAYSLPSEQFMLSNVLSTAESNAYVLWGIGPTKMSELRNDLNFLLELAPDRDAEKILEKYIKDTEKAYSTFLKDKNPASLSFFSFGEREFQSLNTIFEEDEEALMVIKDLAASQSVYTLTEELTLQERTSEKEAMMKRRFRRYYQDALATQSKAPRVMARVNWKSGFKGAIPGSSTKSFGNYLQGYGKKNNQKTFHLLVLGGIQDSVLQKEPGQPIAYEATLGTAFKEDKDNDLSPLIAAVPAGKKAVIELTPLRNRVKNTGLAVNPLLQKILNEYDAVLIVGGGENGPSD